MALKKIRVSNKGLLSALILQFFFFQIVKMTMDPINNWYFSFIVKIKFFLNSVFGLFRFSVGDVFYCILTIVLLYWLVRGIIWLVKKNKKEAKTYSLKILLVVNILYAIFMFSFGILYNHKNFPLFEDPNEKIYVNEMKIVANRLLSDCTGLREKVIVNKEGEFSVDQQKMTDQLYLEQWAFWDIPKQKVNLKVSLFSWILRKVGIAGYYNPFTGEAQIVSGYPDTSIPFTLAHEMAHQVGVAREDEANFYSFYMGESSPNGAYQYSVKYKALAYVLREIYPNDSIFVKRTLENYSAGMKKDREREKRFYSQTSGLGMDMFSYMNDAYLKSNNQDGIVTYNYAVKMIVSFYKQNYPSLFINTETSGIPSAK